MNRRLSPLTTLAIVALLLAGCATAETELVHPQEQRLRAGETVLLTGEIVGFDGWYLEYQSALAKWELPPGTHIPVINGFPPIVDPVTGYEGTIDMEVGAGWVDGDMNGYCLWIGEWLQHRESAPGRAAVAAEKMNQYFTSYGFINLVTAAPGFYEGIQNEVMLDAPEVIWDYFKHNCERVFDQYPDVAKKVSQ